MGQTNVDIVTGIYAAFGRGDALAILEVLDPDVDWHYFNSNEIPWGGRRHGHAAMIEFFRVIGETVDVLEFRPDEIIDAGEHVVVLGHERVRFKSNGRTFESPWVHLFTLRDGKVIRLREAYDTAAIVDAMRS